MMVFISSCFLLVLFYSYGLIAADVCELSLYDGEQTKLLQHSTEHFLQCDTNGFSDTDLIGNVSLINKLYETMPAPVSSTSIFKCNRLSLQTNVSEGKYVLLNNTNMKLSLTEVIPIDQLTSDASVGRELSLRCSVSGVSNSNGTLYDLYLLGSDAKFDSMVSSDSCYYRCIIGDCTKTRLETRTKGNYRALWPFIGICLEIMVLSLIIYLHERRGGDPALYESESEFGNRHPAKPKSYTHPFLRHASTRLHHMNVPKKGRPKTTTTSSEAISSQDLNASGNQLQDGSASLLASNFNSSVRFMSEPNIGHSGHHRPVASGSADSPDYHPNAPPTTPSEWHINPTISSLQLDNTLKAVSNQLVSMEPPRERDSPARNYSKEFLSDSSTGHSSGHSQSAPPVVRFTDTRPIPSASTERGSNETVPDNSTYDKKDTPSRNHNA